MSDPNPDNTPAADPAPENTPAADPKLNNGPAADPKPNSTPADNTLATLANEFIAELPEGLQKVVPSSLSDAEKIKFCRDLMAGVKTITKPNADSPGADRPGRNGGPDLDGMTTNELLNMGLK
jgi:hypothetical protein